MKTGTTTIKSLIGNMLKGDRMSLARLISKVENRASELPIIMKHLYPKTGRAQIIGITGPPGAGKSTLVDQMTSCLRAQGKSVAIVAIDPSSPFSGGAVLGDRIRMQRHAGDSGVFIRSLGTRGKHGGLSHATREVVLVLDAAGFDTILVETAGVGQTELDILQLAETVLVILVPESGDSIQVMKAGLMEIADIFAVNKSDRPEADQLVRELMNMLQLGDGKSTESRNSGSKSSPQSTPQGTKETKRWVPPVQKTQATRGVGVDALVESVQAHQEFIKKSGDRKKRHLEFLRNELSDILREELDAAIELSFGTSPGKAILNKLLERKIDPYSAAKLITYCLGSVKE